MNQHNQLLDALETVIAWELPDECLSYVLNDLVGLIAGDDREDTWECQSVYRFS